MRREIPISKIHTLWRADGRWFQTRNAAYYAIAKALVLERYPRWLDDRLADDEMGDLAEQCGIRDWRARRDHRMELFWTPNGEHFDLERWRAFVRRLAHFLRHVDDRRGELMERMPYVAPEVAIEIERYTKRVCKEWAASVKGLFRHG